MKNTNEKLDNRYTLMKSHDYDLRSFEPLL